VNKSGKLKYQYLPDEYKGISVEDEDFILEKLRKKIVGSWDELGEEHIVKTTREKAYMISIDSWFFKLDETFRMKIFNEIPLLKF